MAKIQELSILEKPREKAERFGIDKLTDAELLALVINVGTVGHSSLEIAKEILKEAGSLDVLVSKPYEYYFSFKGLNKVNALKLKSMFEIIKRINEKKHLQNESIIKVNSESLFKRYSLSLSGLTQENLIIIILNKNKQIIFESTLFKGDDALSVVSTREILRLLTIHNGYFFYLIHNHPNNSLKPSQGDILFTNKIKEKAERIGVKLIDHLIITSNNYYSFLHEKLLNEWQIS